ncbi:TPA: hypothetical protein ACG5DM_003870 [Pseudomonas putida]
MLSKPELSKQSAAQRFFDAFERLKNGTTIILPKGTLVSQNNVAREAGCDPSALKKKRHPHLVEAIQSYTLDHNQQPKSVKRKATSVRKEAKALKDQIEELKKERDLALSLLAEADNKIFDLTIENSRLQALGPKTNVTSFPLSSL